MVMFSASINLHCFTLYVMFQHQNQAFDLILHCGNHKIKMRLGFYGCLFGFLHTWTVLMILFHVIKTYSISLTQSSQF